MLNQKDLNTLEKGNSLNHFLLVRKCELRLTRAGKNYLALELGDQTASYSSNMWENFEDFYETVSTGDIVKVTGSMDDYQGTPQIKINTIKVIADSEEVSATDFLPKSKRNFEVMKKEFVDRIEAISNSELKSLINLIFNDENFKKFYTAPAGKSWHHSYIHGLLEHTSGNN